MREGEKQREDLAADKCRLCAKERRSHIAYQVAQAEAYRVPLERIGK